MWRTTSRDETPVPAIPDDFGFAHATSVLPAIDVLIARYAGSRTVDSAEVVDMLLDLRLLAELDALAASKT